jgi:predicted PhzF superfamily epimerase YddE/YHI9
MSIPLVQVDAFTDRRFAGNPAAVCILPAPQSDRWMQDVAREMNLSETAFLVADEDGYSLRWFTPAVEVDLCGHATLASAHVLWEAGYLAPDAEARFHTLSGLLTARRVDGWIEMNFPSESPAPAEAPGDLLTGLAVEPRWVGKNRMDWVVEVASEAEVRGLAPDFTLLGRAAERGVIVTARAREFDFVSRFFGPAAGVPEDPVTGSAHCALAPYWAERLGKKDMVAFQASARGGVVRVRLAGERVILGGQAVTVLEGKLIG